MNLNELFPVQEELDKRIVEEHNLHDQDLKKKKALAGIVELAETANEGRWFKFWSTDQKARTIVVCSRCDGVGLVKRGKNVRGLRKCRICGGAGEMDKNPLLEEYVDTVHFMISIALEYGYTGHAYKQPKQTDLTDRTLDIVYLLSSLRHIRDEVRHQYIRLIFNDVIALGYQFGFTEKVVIDAYYKKNAINHERQENNY